MCVNSLAMRVLLCSLVWAGCQGDAAQKPLRRSGPVGVLSGRIRLAEGAQLPAYTALDFVRRPLHQHELPAPPAECAAAIEDARTPVQLGPDRSLSGIVVAASDFTRVRERAPKIHKVVIEHCRLKPSIIAATGGDQVSIRNRDTFGFEPLIGPSYVGSPLERGDERRIPLSPGGFDSILCSLGAPCGRTDLLVFYHPVHSVTDAQGNFRMANFPASELVRVVAWHPLFEEKDGFVWLEPGEKSSIELNLSPKARFVPSLPASQIGHVTTANGSP